MTLLNKLQVDSINLWPKHTKDDLRAFLTKKNGICIDLLLLAHTFQNSITRG